MDRGNFLYEIGTEELPAGYIAGAIEKLRDSFVNDLKDYKLAFEQMMVYSTPRRLAIKIFGIDATQADEMVERTGPARKVAIDENGALTKAGEGFVKGAGVCEKDIYFTQTPKGEYIAAKVFIAGKPTYELLPSMMKNAVERISFPKTMKWGEQKFMFARPIRWIVALYDDEVIDFEFCGVQAGRVSHGIRYHGSHNPITINAINDYPDELKKVEVIADREERKTLIRKQLEALSDENIAVIPDERLLDIVTDLVEFPTAVKANFDEKYLALPAKIITSTLSQNQKYFSTTNLVSSDQCSASRGSGHQDTEHRTLANTFVFISNGDPAHSDIIKIGNEKVVSARLADADFYFKEDTKKPLTDYVEKLSEVVFQAKLGTLLEKTERVKTLCQYFIDTLKLDKDLSDDIERAAHLAKADLVTTMLGEKEFTKLQGYIGMHYALLSGEKPAVAKAIYEHYMPRGQNDDLPSEIVGAIVAIADKLDTVCGIIGVGLMPTGSADPFAIRRAANGIVQIIDKYEFDVSLVAIVEVALKGQPSTVRTSDYMLLQTQIVNFLKQRIKWLLEEVYHIEYDIVDALDIFDWDSIREIKNRAIDLQSFKSQKEFQILVSGYKRVANILEKNAVSLPSPSIQGEQKRSMECNRAIACDEYEIRLYDHLQKIKKDIEPLLSQMAYKEIMERIVPLGADIDTFFDKVMVMCDDEALRMNRLALLAEIRDLFLKIADISRISYEG